MPPNMPLGVVLVAFVHLLAKLGVPWLHFFNSETEQRQ